MDESGTRWEKRHVAGAAAVRHHRLMVALSVDELEPMVAALSEDELMDVFDALLSAAHTVTRARRETSDEGRIKRAARRLIGASAARQKTLLTDPTMDELRKIRTSLLVTALVVGDVMAERETERDEKA